MLGTNRPAAFVGVAVGEGEVGKGDVCGVRRCRLNVENPGGIVAANGEVGSICPVDNEIFADPNFNFAASQSNGLVCQTCIESDRISGIGVGDRLSQRTHTAIVIIGDEDRGESSGVRRDGFRRKGEGFGNFVGGKV